MKTLYTITFIQLLATVVLAQKPASTLTFKEIDSLLLMHYHKGDYAAAIPYAELGTEKAKQQYGEKDSVYAEYLSDLGFFYYQAARYKEVEAIFLKTLAIEHETLGENHPAYLESLNNLASLYQKLDNYAKAEQLFQQLIALEEKNPNLPQYDYSLSKNNLAALYRDKGDFEKAEALFLDAIKTLSKIQKNAAVGEFEYAKILNNMAINYTKMGRYEEAEPLFWEALDLMELFLGKGHPDYANTLNDLAALYSNLGKYEQAEALYLQTIEIDKRTLGSDHPSNAVNLNNLAELYRKTGRSLDAKALYISAKELLERTAGAQDPSYAASLNNLAILEANTGNYKEAETLYLQAQALWEKKLGKSHPLYANALNNLAELYEKQTQFSTAEKYYQQALSVREKALGSAHPDYLKTLNNMAGLYAKMDNFSLAADCARRALLANCKAENIDSAALIANLDGLAKYDFHSDTELIASLQAIFNTSQRQYQRTNDKNYLRTGYAALKAAMFINEKMRNSLSDEKDKLRILEQMTNLVHKAIGAGLDLSETQNQSNLQELFGYAEQNKSILLADAVKGNRAQILGDLPDSLALREQALYKQKDIIKKRRYETNSATEKAILAAEENALNDEIRLFIESIKGRYPKYHKLKYANITAHASDVQKLLDEETLLLEYFVFDSLSYLFSVSKTQVQVYPLAIYKDSLAPQIRRLRQSLSDYAMIQADPVQAYQNFTQPAHWFYQQTLAPALQNPNIKNLIIIADGELGHLPFEIFLVEPAPEGGDSYNNLHYLLRDYNINYNYSATLWKENLETAAKNNNHKMLGCAARYGNALDSSLIKQRGNYLYDLRQSLQALPAARKEVEGLAGVFSGDFMFDANANETFFKQHAPDYGIIHLAMHGLLHRRLPVLSSLAFSEDGDSLNDNFLQGYEIAHLKLNADLVVLSACETGYGNFEQGEGVVSIARSFMYAGSPSLVVSLWQVNDNSTAIIMNLFYDYLSQGQHKDAALRQAKLNYIEQAKGAAAHPAFWSPFIQLGDNRPVQLETQKSSWLWWAIAGGIGVLGAGGALLLALRRRKK